MHRRHYLALLSGGLAPVAGCLSVPDRGPPRERQPSQPPVTAAAGADLPVPHEALYPAIHSTIPAVTDPAFGPDWDGLEITRGSATYRPRLGDSDPVIGVERGGRARAYPLAVLSHHEIVNDRLDGPLLVTYCPQCGSGMTAIRRVGGEAAVFTVSHFLWRANLVMRDGATGSLWSQLLATAIRGPATGAQLDLVPSSLESWGSWRAAHPDTQVLLPPPLSATEFGGGSRDYGYDRFRDTAPIIGEDAGSDSRTLVIGVKAGGAARAYPFEAVAERGVVNDRVGGVPVVVAVTPDRSLVAYRRDVGGTTLRFEPAGEGFARAGGSRWLLARGVAVSGPHAGTHLRRANDLPPMFRFAWEDFHPGTSVFGAGR